MGTAPDLFSVFSIWIYKLKLFLHIIYVSWKSYYIMFRISMTYILHTFTVLYEHVLLISIFFKKQYTFGKRSRKSLIQNWKIRIDNLMLYFCRYFYNIRKKKIAKMNTHVSLFMDRCQIWNAYFVKLPISWWMIQRYWIRVHTWFEKVLFGFYCRFVFNISADFISLFKWLKYIT